MMKKLLEAILDGYDTMEDTVENMVAVYGISEVEAADIIQALIHD
jgi:hypothetical protein